MKSLRTLLACLLLAVLALAVYGWWRTTPALALHAAASATGPEPNAPLIDTSALDTARKLLPMASTPEELQLATAAIDKADHLQDLVFAAALRDATEHPPAPTPAIKAAQARLDAASDRLVADNLRVVQLTAALAKAKGDRNDPLEGELALAQAQFEVDQYELQQAVADLGAVGGDSRARIEALVAEHKAVSAPVEAAKKLPAQTEGAQRTPDLIALVRQGLQLRRKDDALHAAMAQTAASLATLTGEREALVTWITAQRAGTAAPDAQAATPGTRAPEVSAALLATTRQVAERQIALSGVDNRITTERGLASLYASWRTLVAQQMTDTLHGVLLAVAIIAGICLVLLFLARTMGAAFGRFNLDRRQVAMLRTVTTAVLQVIAILAIAIVIFGIPTQLGVFLGLAGAGLTVALKDFIVAFIGWLVLMGRNGVRLGDWVEINGVAGEVVELGIFHTVLLETGNWTDSGHPTGRRVTFTNSFAIEGHYFNFSTTGQWLWDELRVVVPTGLDLNAFIASISQKAKDATAKNASQAEEEWRRAAPAHQLTSFSAEPAINVKPVIGGTEISLRYISHANERYLLRATLNQAAVDLLGTPRAAAK